MWKCYKTLTELSSRTQERQRELRQMKRKTEDLLKAEDAENRPKSEERGTYTHTTVFRNFNNFVLQKLFSSSQELYMSVYQNIHVLNVK